MKLIIICFFVSFQNNLFAEDRPSLSTNQLINGCKNSKDSICKTITQTKESVESIVKKTLPPELSATTILAIKIVSDKGVRLKNPIFTNDHILIQVNQISYGINISF
jgi:hypothetical protein